ncbi:MAG: 30S ribosomal protein S20 [Malacoplasma sp.]|nr:30S ribosomal protein S20 [Mycoplasmataceae bacterium]MDD7685811.1 30S ribosomal protein S20 [Mycoplasmataceae bacterium]MDY2887207.1 30S ribosomal protein S20 [Malacoplasma sp.]
MANIKSNIKTISKSSKRRAQNRIVKTTIKNDIKRAKTTAKSEDLNVVFKKLDSAVARKVITQNKANRLKSRATKAVNKKNIAAK